MTPCSQRTETAPDDGPTTFAQDLGHNHVLLLNEKGKNDMARQQDNASPLAQFLPDITEVVDSIKDAFNISQEASREHRASYSAQCHDHDLRRLRRAIDREAE